MRGVMKVHLLSTPVMFILAPGAFHHASQHLHACKDLGTITAGYIGLGAYFDGENEGGLRLRQSQPVVMRFPPTVGARRYGHEHPE